VVFLSNFSSSSLKYSNIILRYIKDPEDTKNKKIVIIPIEVPITSSRIKSIKIPVVIPIKAPEIIAKKEGERKKILPNFLINLLPFGFFGAITFVFFYLNFILRYNLQLY